MERVLIVEDDENIRQLLKLTLASFNYELIDFENGKDAYDYLQDNKVDLAILDLMLPGMSGYFKVYSFKSIFKRFASNHFKCKR